MCGIAGFLSEDTISRARDIGARMSLAVQHRGPDDGGIWADEQAGMCLAQRRLSIIDLSPAGRQPMESATGRFVVSFNGEIYNHLEMRTRLEAIGKGGPWRGHSDTETLLAGFEHWGVEATLRHAVGMFALAVWDRTERQLKLARDRLGEKPLYYGWVGSKRAFVFGSELKVLREFPGFANPLSRDALALYFQHSVVPAPYTIYKDICKLRPGTILTCNRSNVCNGNVNIEPYWVFEDAVSESLATPFLSDTEAITCLDQALREAVALQAVADVPLGAFLSGGVDSSTIVALMQAQSSRPVKTFTVGFDESGFDEAPHALAIARYLGTDHEEIRVSSADARSVIPSLPTLYDEPFADSSQIPTYLVCRAARQHVTVALSGDAGDELFGGYNRYLWGKRIWRWLSWIPRDVRHGLGAALGRVPAPAWDAIVGAVLGRSRVAGIGHKTLKLADRLNTVTDGDGLYRSLVTEWPQALPLVREALKLGTQLDLDAPRVLETEQRMMYWDTLTYLPDDILTKVDRAAMGVSLETRVPFLDHRIVELAWRLPLEMKIRGGQGKWALRQVLYRYVPRELIERPKAGFAVPVGEWLRGPLRDWAEELLKPSRLKAEGLLNPHPICEVWRQHLSGAHDWTPRLWSVLMFQAWLEANA